MDPELRAYLDSMRAEMVAIERRAIGRDAATRMGLESKIDEARREAGAMFESLVHEIKALPEGLSTLQRQEAERIAVAREQDLMDRHILPLEASAADHEKRLKAVENRR